MKYAPNLAKNRAIHSLPHSMSNLRRTVAARLMRDFGIRIPPPLIRRILDEAAEAVQETEFPHLFFPGVAEEKARFVFAALASSSIGRPQAPLQHAA